MAIIGVLVALLAGMGLRFQKWQKLNVAQAEFQQAKTWIDDYGHTRRYFPPDNPANPAMNQLLFELKGTVSTNVGGQPAFTTLDGTATILATDVPIVFGPSVNGFMNFPSPARTSDDVTTAVPFLKEIRSAQVGNLVIGTQPSVAALLVCSIPWSNDPLQQIVPTTGNPHALQVGLNPWRYVSSHPTNNPNTYDLWIDIPVRGKMYRINNWSSKPQEL